jgi:hypothetical protein
VVPGEFFLPRDGVDSLLESGPAKRRSGMVIGGLPRPGIADQYGAAHAAPGGLGLVVLIAVVVVVIILSKRGK